MSERQPGPSELLRQLPAVNRLLEHPRLAGSALPRALRLEAVRQVLGTARRSVRAGGALPGLDALAREALAIAQQRARPALRPVINATGILLHTNLGRAPLSPAAAAHVAAVAGQWSNLEFDLERGRRGGRAAGVNALLTRLTGAEAALVVNNNAAAVYLALRVLAGPGREEGPGEVILSRGELVEIGGSFRMPDVMEAAGCRLREVGTTNRTHLRDYQRAINPETALLCKVHPSNYRVSGFTKAVPARELVALAHRHRLPVFEDLGSGLIGEGPPGTAEPTVRAAVEAGIDLISFSGDKLLGGPQAGILVGSAALVGRLARDPMMRALRPDKMTLAGLEVTLLEHLQEPPGPRTRRIWSLPTALLEERAQRLLAALPEALVARFDARVEASESPIGGGSLPQEMIPGVALSLRAGSALAQRLRRGEPPVVARLARERLWIELRTVLPDQIDSLATALGQALAEESR